MKFQTLLLSGLLLSTPALAQPQSHDHGQPASPSPSAAPAEAGSERKICRSIQESTGTRIGNRKKLCLTQAEWRRFNRVN